MITESEKHKNSVTALQDIINQMKKSQSSCSPNRKQSRARTRSDL